MQTTPMYFLTSVSDEHHTCGKTYLFFSYPQTNRTTLTNATRTATVGLLVLLEYETVWGPRREVLRCSGEEFQREVYIQNGIQQPHHLD